MQKSTRIDIAKDTLEVIQNGYYVINAGEKVDISVAQQASQNNTVLYTPEAAMTLIQELEILPQAIPTEFEVNDLTTLDSVRVEAGQAKHLGYLNFASARNPGGGFLNGSQAQEESIARASGLYPCLLLAETYYSTNRAERSCFYTDHFIFAPHVPVFKFEDGTYMDRPVLASVITAPAVNTGIVRRAEPTRIDEILPRMRQRMDMVLAAFHAQQCDTLVLGAWGCGVFQNDPKEIAQLFFELLSTKYKDAFKRIIFSVYARDDKFIKPFQELFGL